MEVDTVYLLSVLEQLTHDLSVPFLERRGRDHCHKRSSVGKLHTEELRDAVETLNARERELLAAVGIAKMLLDEGQKTLTSLEEIREELQNSRKTIWTLQQEVAILRDKAKSEEEKNEHLAALLSEAETNVEKLREIKLHYEQFFRNKDKHRENGLEKIREEEKETAEMRQKQLEIRNLALESRIKDLENQIFALENDLSQQKKQNSEMKQEILLILQKNRDSERIIEKNKAEMSGIEEENKQKEIKMRVFRQEIEKLKEELAFFSPEKQEKRVKNIHFGGFFGENISEDEINTPLLHLDTVLNLEIPGEIVLKDPFQEYFKLVKCTQTTQAVKLNSPYMDTICTVPTQELYGKAMRLSVPFHKWHVWIESQLTTCYLESLYSGEKRKRRVVPG